MPGRFGLFFVQGAWWLSVWGCDGGSSDGSCRDCAGSAECALARVRDGLRTGDLGAERGLDGQVERRPRCHDRRGMSLVGTRFFLSYSAVDAAKFALRLVDVLAAGP